MKFSKHKVTEKEMLSELLDHCNKMLRKQSKTNEDFANMYCCISPRTQGVEIIYKYLNKSEQIIMATRYDERNDFFYVVETLDLGERKLENRVIIEDKEAFYAYFDHKYKKIYTGTHVKRHEQH